MKLWLSIVLCFALTASANPYQAVASSSGVTVTPCANSFTNDGATAGSVWGTAATLYWGQANWTDGGTPITICRIDFELTEPATSSSSTYRAYIITMSSSAPTYNMGTLPGAIVATSDPYTGVDNNVGFVQFSFPTPYLTTASQRYALVVAPTVARGANDVAGFIDNDVMPGNKERFSSVGAAQDASGTDTSMKIYWQ
jgi:hypothetical protein